MAREGAQKLKEISYVHAEAYPASELKHGPLALIGPDLPTVAIVPDDELLDKNLTTLGEIRARGGPLLVIGPPHGRTPSWPTTASWCRRTRPSWTRSCCRSRCSSSPTTPPSRSSRDVDKPRNLAKSVTVE